jgi:hypothetical protein
MTVVELDWSSRRMPHSAAFREIVAMIRYTLFLRFQCGSV